MFSARRESDAAGEARLGPATSGPTSRPGTRATVVDLRSLQPVTELLVETRSSRYRIVVLDNALNVIVQGGQYFSQATRARVEGCAFGGNLLDSGWIALDACLEFSLGDKRVITSRVQSIAVNVGSAAA